MTQLKDLEYIIMERSVTKYHGPGHYGNYARLGIVLVDWSKVPKDATEPKMLSNRARGVIRVIREYGPYYVGQGTSRCEYAKKLPVVEEQCKQLNKELSYQLPMIDILFDLVEKGDLKLSELSSDMQVKWDIYQESVMLDSKNDEKTV